MFGKMSEHTRLAFVTLYDLKELRYDFTINIPMLTHVQRQCVDEIKQHLKHGVKVLDVVAVTGAGKTEIMLDVAAIFVKRRKAVAFVCPRIDVIRELYERIERYFPEHLIIGWHGKNKSRRIGHIYVMTMHQLIHYVDFFDLIIIDEADAYPFVERDESKVLQRFVERGLKQGGVRIYMTATPKHIHGAVVYLMTKFNRRKLPTPKFVHIPFLELKIRYRIKCKQLERLKENRQWLLFVPSVTCGNVVYDYMKWYLSERTVAFVYGSDQRRIEKIQQFRDKAVDILITTSILERGVTFDDVSVALFFPEHHLMSKEMIVQVCGRVDRRQVETPYYLEAYYSAFTTKIKSVSTTIKEMNEKGAAAL